LKLMNCADQRNVVCGFCEMTHHLGFGIFI
jgi:hypothetical protein